VPRAMRLGPAGDLFQPTAAVEDSVWWRVLKAPVKQQRPAQPPSPSSLIPEAGTGGQDQDPRVYVKGFVGKVQQTRRPPEGSLLPEAGSGGGDNDLVSWARVGPKRPSPHPPPPQADLTQAVAGTGEDVWAVTLRLPTPKLQPTRRPPEGSLLPEAGLGGTDQECVVYVKGFGPKVQVRVRPAEGDLFQPVAPVDDGAWLSVLKAVVKQPQTRRPPEGDKFEVTGGEDVWAAMLRMFAPKRQPSRRPAATEDLQPFGGTGGQDQDYPLQLRQFGVKRKVYFARPPEGALTVEVAPAGGTDQEARLYLRTFVTKGRVFAWPVARLGERTIPVAPATLQRWRKLGVTLWLGT
jgi:hypothetical protein